MNASFCKFSAPTFANFCRFPPPLPKRAPFLRFRLTDVLVLRRGGLAPPQAANLLLWGVCATVQALLRAVQAMSEARGNHGEVRERFGLEQRFHQTIRSIRNQVLSQVRAMIFVFSWWNTIWPGSTLDGLRLRTRNIRHQNLEFYLSPFLVANPQ